VSRVGARLGGEDVWYGRLPRVASAPERRPLVGHDRPQPGAWSGRLVLRLDCLTPLHLGSGALRLDAGLPVAAVARDGRGVPVVPGASLKGLLRFVVEAVTASCDPLEHGRCDPGQGRLCPACSLFGAIGHGGYRARVAVGELRLVGEPSSATEVLEVPAMYQPRKPAGERRYKVYRHGREPVRGGERVEVVRAGACFRGPLWFEDVADPELGLLAFALGLDGSFRPKLGGFRPAYLGSVALAVEAQELRQGGHPVAALDLAGAARRYAEAATGPAREAIAALRREWSWDPPRGRPWSPVVGRQR
jgi:CRISPR-associated protein Csm3